MSRKMDEFVFIFRTHVRMSRTLFENCPQKRDSLFLFFFIVQFYNYYFMPVLFSL